MAAWLRTEIWAAIGIVCGAILAAVEVGRRVVRPMWSYIRRTMRRVNSQADEFLGDEAKGILGVPRRLSDVEQGLVELREGLAEVRDAVDRYVRWHPDPGDTSGRTEPNGIRTRRGRTRRDGQQRG